MRRTAEPRWADPPVTPVAQPTATLLWVAAGLVFLAGVQLFVFSDRTATYFAWTVEPPLTAAFLGAAYWASVAFEASAARARRWADARIALPSVFVFTVLTLAVTLVHIDRFHLDADLPAGTRVVTWVWIAIYAIVPVLIVAAWSRQARMAGSDPPRQLPLDPALGVVVAAQAVLLVAVGAGLLLAPLDVGAEWPWPLSALTGRAVGAWLLSLGVAAGHALYERDLARLRPAAIAYLAFGVLQLVALARYPDTVDWTAPATVTYVGFLLSTVTVGAAVLRDARLMRRPPRTPRP